MPAVKILIFLDLDKKSSFSSFGHYINFHKITYQGSFPMTQHHDLFFKETFSYSEHAVDFLKFVLPAELAEKVDYSSIASEKDSYVDSDLSAYFSDTIYSCLLKDEKIRLAFLFEHKSSPDYDLTFQLLRYIVKLWESTEKLKKPRIPVIPVVLYHGKKSWNPGYLSSQFKNLPDVARPFIPDFEYIFIDLSAYSDEDIKQSVFSIASLKVAMLIMKNISEQKEIERHLTDILEVGKLYFREKQGLNFLKAVINYIFQATEIEPEKLIEAFTYVSEKGKEIAMTTAEKLRQEGHKEGLIEGQKSKVKMMTAMIRNARDNGLSEDMIAKIVNIDLNFVQKVINNETIDIPLYLLEIKD
jgi:predicted transposase/invertase (TIGR01784 family)